MNIDICITRTVYRALKAHGRARMARWTRRVARRRLRLARIGQAIHV
jgi:hypothetical protein